MAEIQGLRTQILANAKMVLKMYTVLKPQPELIDVDVVVFGAEEEYTAAIISHRRTAIEADPAPGPEEAMRKLLLATCELLESSPPKVSDKGLPRKVEGVGLLDEGMINVDILQDLDENFQ